MKVNNSPRNSNLFNTARLLLILGFIFSLLSSHTVLAKSRRPVTVSFPIISSLPVRLLGSSLSSSSLDSTESRQLFRMLKPGKRSRSVTLISRGERLSQSTSRVFFSSSLLELSVVVKWSESNFGMWFVLRFNLPAIQFGWLAIMCWKCAAACGVGNANLQVLKRKIVPCDVSLLLVMI